MVNVNEEAVSEQIDAMRQDLSQDASSSAFLEQVLESTGQEISAEEKQVTVWVLTKEEMMRRFALRNN